MQIDSLKPPKGAREACDFSHGRFTNVEIMAKQEIYVENVTLVHIVTAVALVALLVIGILAIVKGKGFITALLATGVVGVFCIILTGSVFAKIFAIPTGRYKYVAKVKSRISMTEFNEKYDLILQDGDIWIFEDGKENK